nr:Chain C, NUCLEOLAR PROTEIN 3 [Saccharomyces cerevisiae]
RERSPTR